MINGAPSPFLWENDFPPVYGHTSIAFLKRCPGFFEAKHGDLQAALSVAKICIKTKRIAELKRKYPHAKLLPVQTKNKLPEALACLIGMEMDQEVRKAQTRKRKTLTAMERLLDRPEFEGHIQPGTDYILVDDIVAQGGTVSALRKYVITHGGTVAAVTALAHSVNGHIIAPNQQEINLLNPQFISGPIAGALQIYGIASDIRELTRAQIRYLLCFMEPQRFLAKMVKTYSVLAG